MNRKVTYPRLRGALASKGISFKELASLMTERGVELTPAALSNKMNETREFKKNEMQVIAEILEESPVILFFDIEYTKCVLRARDELSCTS